MGSPGKIVRHLDAEAIQRLRNSALNYQENAKRFSNQLNEV
jgi:carbonic anhydrase/acetyltransferase-like protein (isoleucine patch superfamily)